MDRDPVVEYKMSAFDMFNEMITSIQEDTLRMLYHVHVEQKIEREQVAKVTGTNKDDSAGPKKPVQRKEIKVYPNDPAHVEAVRNTNSAVDVRIRSDSFISVEKTPISVCGEFITTERAVMIL